MKIFLAWLVVVIGLVGLVIGLSLLLAFPTLWVVNYLLAPQFLIFVFGMAKLTFWKAFWLNFLAGILFKSSSTGGGK